MRGYNDLGQIAPRRLARSRSSIFLVADAPGDEVFVAPGRSSCNIAGYVESSLGTFGGGIMLNRLFLTLLVALGLAHLGACATLFTGTTDEIKFSANVPGVRLTIDGETKGTLPLTVKQSRDFMHGQEFRVKLEAPGYVTQEFQLKRSFNWIALLDVTSIPTSGGIDYYTGALMRFEPNEYHVQMQKRGKSSSEFEREKRLWRYALVNYRRVQQDVSRGGGEHLQSFASALGGTRGGADALIVEQALRRAPALLEASGPHDFIHRLNDMLAADPSLRAYHM